MEDLEKNPKGLLMREGLFTNWKFDCTITSNFLYLSFSTLY